ncbi:hypothetical protein PVT67_09905 [Gallaecimonas kandeliae]|uniref:hypothetical protein n=1 Tax=Gallaecimonas kandeliae TaxID=3029055 RepID=UPI0026486576|nr:hypothetical protein [Gallaecimonas kandeliae]WKE64013.1 hypothetical protein PVT67_09905 [Gallaecimonas kandeliae]
MLKKKFTLHLDALLVIGLLFVASVGFNAFQQYQIGQITQENLDLQMQGEVDKLNLASQQATIDRLVKKTQPDLAAGGK